MPRFYFRNPSAPTPNASVTVGSVALIEHDGGLLLDRRADTGTWGIIGGALEPDETVEATARREVLEETGLTVATLALFGTFSDPTRLIEYRDGTVRRVITFAFRATVESPGPLRLSSESTELRYVPIEELLTLEIVPTHQQIVEAYVAAHPNFPHPILL